MKHFILLSFLLLSGLVIAQPGNNVYVGQLNIKKGSVKNVIAITDSEGYDNQPFFHPEQPLVYFSSANNQNITDIKSFHLKTKETRNITNSPTVHEYSPTVTPDRSGFSCILQLENGSQYLGKYNFDTGKADTLINNLTIGYHCWVNEDQLALFVLGDPHELRLYTLSSKKDAIVDHNIGRSFHTQEKNKNKFYYISKEKTAWTINEMDAENKTKKIIAPTLKNNEDISWTPNGQIVSSDGTDIFMYDPNGNKTWKKLDANLPDDQGKLSRIAISADGKWIAFVLATN